MICPVCEIRHSNDFNTTTRSQKEKYDSNSKVLCSEECSDEMLNQFDIERELENIIETTPKIGFGKSIFIPNKIIDIE